MQDVSMVNGLCAPAADLAHTLPGGTWKQPISGKVHVDWPEVEHQRESWLTQKLKNTRIWDRGRILLEPHRSGFNPDGTPIVDDPGKPYDKLKMPTFYLTDEQVHAIVTFVISNRHPLITPALLARAQSGMLTTSEDVRQLALQMQQDPRARLARISHHKSYRHAICCC